ncbi:MORC family CW-type zinc finger protein 3a [Aplochiton taeniatus]
MFRKQLCPKFLHTNSTSHTWPFSAIAELTDNAYDPDVKAKQFWIDKITINGQMCLSFMDNGNGLNYEKMQKMLSFGYSDKTAINGHLPIGFYGNGFKSGSMRLGRDAIVFSKSQDAMAVGLLSQSYLEEIGAEQIIVPIISFKSVSQSEPCMMLGNLQESEQHKASLQDILRYSLFKTEEELLTELNTITSTGTRIIIWNLRRRSSGNETLEFDFKKELYDIQIPCNVYEGMNENSKHSELSTQSIPESIYSLRAYCSILYMKPRMQIILCGMIVKSQLISKSLAYIVKDTYKPIFLTKGVPIVFGYNTKSKDNYGLMMYYKNRLIKSYERVGCQHKGNTRGVGVIGVIECNFLEPTHNKQDFDNTEKYRNAIISLGKKLEDYWKEMDYKKKKDNPYNQIPLEDTPKRPDQNWVQCNSCLKWRKLPDGIDCARLPEEWFCHKNPDPQFRSCQVEEEQEDSEDERPYKKTHKLQSSSSNRTMPIISEVQSLATPSRVKVKRTLPMTTEKEPKRPRANGFHSSIPETALPGAEESPSSTTSSLIFPDSEHEDDIPATVVTGLSPPAHVDCLQVSLSTQTDGKNRVKFEGEEETRAGKEETGSVNEAMQKAMGSEGSGKANTVACKEERAEQPLGEEGEAGTQQSVSVAEPRLSSSEDGVFPLPVTDLHDMTEAQEQQDQLMELLQSAANERDSFKEQVSQLEGKLRDKENTLQELTSSLAKSECAHQATQTEGADQDYQSLYEQAQREAEVLRQENEALLQTSHAAICSRDNPQDGASISDDVALQVDTLLRNLDQIHKQRDELQSRMVLLEEEKVNLASQCDQLRSSLRQESESGLSAPAREGALNHPGGETGGMSNQGAASVSVEADTLTQLRRRVGRLLLTFVPALDLEQVNYECSVIDEILEQVLTNVELMDGIL